MATLPTITHVFRCAFNWLHSDGQTATNVIHIRGDSGTETTATVMAALDATVTANMWECVVPGAVVTDVAITPLDGTSATNHFVPVTEANWTGQNGTDFVPQVAHIIKLTTALRGRSHRGRVFLPFTAESEISNGLLNSGSVGNLTTHWNAFNTNLFSHGGGFDWGVASYKLSTFETGLDVACETVLGTQRRRQGRLRSA